MFTDSTGKIRAKAKAFDEDLLIADIIPAPDGAIQVKPLQTAAAPPANMSNLESRPAPDPDRARAATRTGTRRQAS